MSYKSIRKTLLLVILIALHMSFSQAQTSAKKLSVIFIGNSITQGAGLPSPQTQAPPVIAGKSLEKMKGISTVRVYNVGKSGSTTVDWLPGEGQLFSRAANAAAEAKADTSMQLIFSLVLGTNDSAIKGPHGAPVSTEDYLVNLKIITGRLLDDYPGSKLIIQYPIWYSENTYNGSMYLAEGLQRLQSYFPQINKLVKRYQSAYPHRVYAGNKKVFKYFKLHTSLFQAEKGQQGIFSLHPNEEGAARLGEYWADGIYKALNNPE